MNTHAKLLNDLHRLTRFKAGSMRKSAPTPIFIVTSPQALRKAVAGFNGPVYGRGNRTGTERVSGEVTTGKLKAVMDRAILMHQGGEITEQQLAGITATVAQMLIDITQAAKTK